MDEINPWLRGCDTEKDKLYTRIRVRGTKAKKSSGEKEEDVDGGLGEWR